MRSGVILFLMKTLIFILLTISSLFSNAQTASSISAKEVARVFYAANCDQRCQQGVVVDYFQAKDLFRLPSQVYRNLQKVAYDQAQIWGDTILEGDYAADGKTELVQVMVIKQNAKVVGYAITYSERAWYTGHCAYISQNPSTLATCEEGRIHETSFVSADLHDAQVGQNQFAEFKSKD